MPEFAGARLYDLIFKHYDASDGFEVAKMIDRWLARGDGAAVYENADLSSHQVGMIQIVSFGSSRAQIEVTDPIQLPQTLPDIGGAINWRYQLVGWYRGEPGSISPARTS